MPAKNVIQERQVLPYGTHALHIKMLPTESAVVFAKTVANLPLAASFEEVVPAEDSVLIFLRSLADKRHAMEALKSLPFQKQPDQPDRVLEIPTVYEGLDLQQLAADMELSQESLITWHSGQLWRVAFNGFSAGFAYLKPDNNLVIPRRDSPRSSVPQGSVSVAGPYSAIYPSAQPSGWQNIGKTDIALWDSRQSPPTPLLPGTGVFFRPVRELIEAGSDPEHATLSEINKHDQPRFEVLDSHPGVTIQDIGRKGWRSYGVSPSGAFDKYAHTEANRQVGNHPHEAAIEIVGGGLKLRSYSDHVISITGADSESWIFTAAKRRKLWPGTPTPVGAGEEVVIGPPRKGFSQYLAVRGGIEAEAELGSRSRDTLSNIGPVWLQNGRKVFIGNAAIQAVALAPVISYPFNEGTSNGRPDKTILEIHAGPGVALLGSGALDTLTQQTWTVSPQSNRIGIRLRGENKIKSEVKHMNSEGLSTGSIQIPPSGEPIIFGVDHPTTGGYPVVGIVLQEHWSKLAQLEPEAPVRFKLKENHSAGAM